MHEIGPYRFTEQDVERTLANRLTLFDLLPGGWPPDPTGPAAPHRAAVEALTDQALAADPHGCLDVVWREWRAAMGALRSQGAFGQRATGTVAGLFSGTGGVPKHPVEEATIGWRGVEGDRQAARVHHGRPWQALCLWSTEVIRRVLQLDPDGGGRRLDGLNAEGHELFPGAAGENLTLSGLSWERAVPGAQLQVGDVRCELTAWALPCKKNARWFADGDFDAMHHRHGPVSRIYATVLEPGTVRPGDPVVLEPDA